MRRHETYNDQICDVCRTEDYCVAQGCQEAGNAGVSLGEVARILGLTENELALASEKLKKFRWRHVGRRLNSRRKESEKIRVLVKQAESGCDHATMATEEL